MDIIFKPKIRGILVPFLQGIGYDVPDNISQNSPKYSFLIPVFSIPYTAYSIYSMLTGSLINLIFNSLPLLYLLTSLSVKHQKIISNTCVSPDSNSIPLHNSNAKNRATTFSIRLHSYRSILTLFVLLTILGLYSNDLDKAFIFVMYYIICTEAFINYLVEMYGANPLLNRGY